LGAFFNGENGSVTFLDAAGRRLRRRLTGQTRSV